MPWPWFRLRPHPLAAALLLAVPLAGAACGGEDKPSPTTPTGPGSDPSGTVQIRGGERLGWSQDAPSLDALRAHSFTLYVDGSPASLADVRCSDVSGASGYDCSGRLPAMSPGRHVLELTSSWNGQQSTRSAQLTVTVLAALQPQQTELSLPDEGHGMAGTPVASGLGELSWLSPAPDGRLFVVEDRRAVRVVQDGALLHEPAHALDTREGAIVGMAIDPAFERTRAVYVASTGRGRDGGWSLTVTRFRELAGTFGEGAAILTGLPVPARASVPLAVDADGRLYVALAALDGRAGGRAAAAYNGFVLRVSADGAVPRDNPRPSPVVAVGFADPTAIAIDHVHRRVWIAGADPRWPGGVAVFPATAPEGAAWPRVPETALPERREPSAEPVSMLTIAPAGDGVPGIVTLVSDGRVLQAAMLPDGSVGTLERLDLGLDPVSAFATVRGGWSYVAIGRDGSPASLAVVAPR